MKIDLKPLNFFLLILLCATQYELWLGDKNVLDLYDLKETADQTLLQIEAQSQTNRRFSAQVSDLKNGGETVETIARSEFGLIKEGETFYQIIDLSETR